MKRMIVNSTTAPEDLAQSVETYCPRCNRGFTCRMGDVINCQCYSVPLSEKTRELLTKTSQDCLCKNCLQKAELENGAARKAPMKRSKPVLVENIHYYMEGKYCVFTELYHLQRGYCCKNNCRHCPFSKQ